MPEATCTSHSNGTGPAPLGTDVSEMKTTRTNWRLKSVQLFLPAIMLLGALPIGLAGCGTFKGMSWDDREQANKDLAKERQYWPAFKPERSLQDNREVPVQ
jgi:hypothetical protein